MVVAGALARYLSLNAFIEKRIEIAQLERLVQAMAAAARECDVEIITGVTKVVDRNECGGTYFATTGVGVRHGDNVKGAFWHIIQTFVGSLLIIVTALVIHFTGFLLIDPLLGMGFGFVLGYTARRRPLADGGHASGREPG